MPNAPFNPASQFSAVRHGVIGSQHAGAFTVQCRVLNALILREIKSKYGNRRLGFIWALIEPFLFISLFVVGFYLIGRTSQSGIDAPLFFVAGFSPFFMFRDIFSQVSSGTTQQSSLLMFPQVTRMDILLSKVIVNFLISIFVFIVLMAGLYLLGFQFKVDDLLGVLIGLFLLVALGFGLGLVLGALTIRYDFISSVFEPLMGRPLFFASGLFFTASMLPPYAREYILYNPVLHCIEHIRSSLFTGFDSRYVDLSYVLVFALVLISFGLMLLGVFERQRN